MCNSKIFSNVLANFQHLRNRHLRNRQHFQQRAQPFPMVTPRGNGGPLSLFRQGSGTPAHADSP
jgi:hypothetical protein